MKRIQSIDDLTPDSKNANLGTERGRGMLEQSLREFGAGRSILVDKEGVVIAGNKTLEVAEELGLPVRVVTTNGGELVVVQRRDLDLDNGNKTRQLAYMDNRSSQIGLDWDAAQIVADLETDVDLSGLWSDAEIAELVAGVMEESPEDPGPQVDRAEELREKWQTARGQIWEIPSKTVKGKCHRVMCGDSASEQDVGRLMSGAKAQMVLADPPYNVAYTGGSTNEAERTDSYADKMTDRDYTVWLGAVLLNARLASDKQAALHLWFASAKVRYIMNAFEGAGWVQRTVIVWNKLKAHYGALGAQYKHRFEPLFYCYQRGEAPRWYGPTNECTVWDEEQPHINELHPTMKPVPLYERSIRNHTRAGDLILECFGGSGTTVVASERMGRIARLCEISPQFTSVILQRLADMGLEPRLVEVEQVERNDGTYQ